MRRFPLGPQMVGQAKVSILLTSNTTNDFVMARPTVNRVVMRTRRSESCRRRAMSPIGDMKRSPPAYPPWSNVGTWVDSAYLVHHRVERTFSRSDFGGPT